MALKIKEGVKIHAYGHTAGHFDSNSTLSQEILEHLKTRFPDDIEEIKEEKNTTNLLKK